MKFTKTKMLAQWEPGVLLAAQFSMKGAAGMKMSRQDGCHIHLSLLLDLEWCLLCGPTPLCQSVVRVGATWTPWLIRDCHDMPVKMVASSTTCLKIGQLPPLVG